MQRRKPLIFVVISLLVVALVYSSVFAFNVYAAPPDSNWHSSNTCGGETTNPATGDKSRTCCWTGPGPGGLRVNYCQTCSYHEGASGFIYDCKPVVQQALSNRLPPGALENLPTLEQPPPPSPSGPAAPLQGGVLEQPEQGEGATPGFVPGFLERQQLQPPPADQGAAELPPPATEETQPATVEEEQPVPVCQEVLEFNEDLGFCVPEDCPESQVLDEESGICVLEEPEVAEKEPEQQQSEPEEQDQQQSSEEGDDSGEDNTN